MFDSEADRTLDKEIYSSQDYISNPKEIHKKVVSLIQNHPTLPIKAKILDVGCANGAFLLLLSKMLPDHNLQMTGLDLHANLLEMAKENMTQSAIKLETICCSLEQVRPDIGLFNIITSLGTFSIFDNFSVPFQKLYSLLAKGGSIIISTEFNDFPIDVVMRYKDARKDNSEFEKGWNIFSKYLVEKILKNYPDLAYQWIDFKMPFAREKHASDFMRTWTIKTEHDNFQQVNGAQQLVNQSILYV